MRCELLKCDFIVCISPLFKAVSVHVYYCRWFCEGKELENSPDIQIINNGQLHSLIISEAFEEDTGRYSCFASNVYGTDSTSAEIYVEGDAHLFDTAAV